LFQTQWRGKKSRAKGPRKPPKNKPHKLLLEKVNLEKNEREKTEGPRKNSWEYKANHKPVAYGFTPSEKANKRVLAEKNKEMNPSGVVKEHKMKARNKELARIIFEASKNKDPKEAMEAYHKFTAAPDIRVYTALIKTFASQKGYMGEAVEIYNDLKKQNVNPSMITFERLMDCCIENEHLPRGFFFLKEMLRHIRNSKPKQSHLPVFYKLFSLCHKMNNPTRALALYRVMLENKYFAKLEPFSTSEEQFTRNKIPFIFVQQALPDLSESEQREFWIRMNEKTQLGFRKKLEEEKIEEQTYEYLVLDDFTEALRRYENRYQDIYEDTLAVSALDAMTNNGQTFAERVDSFYYSDKKRQAEDVFSLPVELRRILHPKLSLSETFHMQDPRIDDILQSGWKNLLTKGAEIFDEFVLSGKDQSDEFMLGLSPAQVAAVKNPEYHDKLLEFTQRQAFVSTTEEDSELSTEVTNYFKGLELKIANKINWIPVVIGVGDEIFYPSTVGMHELTEETVRQAKQEYLDSIADVDAREQIAANMYDQIMLRFIDPKTKQLIEGLYY
jgi:hypothetical protein